MKYTSVAVMLMISVIVGEHSKAVAEEKASVFHETKEDALKASGLEKYATERNSQILNDISKNIEEIKKSAGNDFGGSWIEYDDKNNVVQVIALAGPANLNFPKNNLSYETKIVRVKFRFSQLDTIAEKSLLLFDGIKGDGDEPMVFGTAIDEQNNKVLVSGRKKYFPEITSRLQSAGFDMSAIHLENQDGPATLYRSLYGGTKILTGNSPTSQIAACTAGFNVVIDNIYPGTITAAHCTVRNGNAKNSYFDASSPDSFAVGPIIGEFFAVGWPDKMDAAIFGNTNFVHTLYPQVISQNGFQSVKPLISPTLNQNVCTYGGTNGWRCGPIKAVSRRVNMGSNTIMEMVEVDLCGGPGDSGGPVIAAGPNGNAIGILTGGLTSGGTGTCGSVFGGGPRPNAIFQALAPYLAKYSNVKLMAQ
ncbi:S1 family peptidase [Acidovorax sp. SUPP2825]|uniref:S1 family peptidase n=1 Tax=Acidovorax sp. SUPP2825 TaxID=2920879 RepID=UPI0023DE528B|nr:S1 family peptidase [Acidovorax sp. SUPP2825]GKS94837.1 S1 family peptidase [Acidovorax sp. SUPP2825]